MKIITKQEILDDLHNRAAVCDFHVLKQKIIVSTVITLCVWTDRYVQTV